VIHAVKPKMNEKIAGKPPILRAILTFATETSLATPCRRSQYRPKRVQNYRIE
jgi:hypothetical protein